MRTTKITIGRLFNLGSYEHVRYELTVEIAEGDSAAKAILGMEKILEALNPKTSTHSRGELDREQHRIEEMRHLLAGQGEEEFRRRHNHFVGTPEEYIARCKECHGKNVAARDAWEARSEKARQMFDDLGGAAVWKDAKLDWECDQYDDP